MDDIGEALSTFRVGIGYDLHRLVEGRRLVLGGVEIPFERGLEGHSDADVLCHAVTDAILGAAGAGDIGRHFLTPTNAGAAHRASTCCARRSLGARKRASRWRTSTPS